MRKFWGRAALACALACAGCASQPLPTAVSPTGPCVQETVSGGGKHRHYHYWKNGVEITSTEPGGVLTAAVGDFAPSRAELTKADHLETAGWALLGVGLAIFLAGAISGYAAAPPPPPGQKGSGWWPGLGIAFGGELFGAGGMLGAHASAGRERERAIALYNAHAAEVGCR